MLHFRRMFKTTVYNCLWDTFMLRFRRMFKTTVYNCSQQLRLQQKVAEARCMDGCVTALLDIPTLFGFFFCILSFLVFLFIEIRQVLICCHLIWDSILLHTHPSRACTLS